mmetsp:Transcript_12122/g.10442  ORF Transcript_12122/g.10442 Transcript_12122/m.10442 type:complete len:352 (-) Transcript_12122:250-1305(-)
MWPFILLGVAVAVVIGFLFVLIMRYLTSVMVWVMLIGTSVGFALLGYLFYSEAKAAESPEFSTDKLFINKDDISLYKNLAYVLWGVSVVSFIFIFLCLRRVRLSIAILKASSEFVKDTPTSLLVAPVMFFVLMLVSILWIIGFIYIWSCGDIQKSRSLLPIGTIEWNSTTKFSFYMIIIFVYWSTLFLFAISYFILASSTCLWYFSNENRDNKSIVSISVSRALFNHIGSIAFGAFVITLFLPIRWFMDWLTEKLNEISDRTDFLVRCCSCCVDCFERFVRYLTNHSYIHIAMTGDSFIDGCQESFFLMIRNIIRFGTIQGLGDFFVLLGSVFISAFTTYIGYKIIMSFDE